VSKLVSRVTCYKAFTALSALKQCAARVMHNSIRVADGLCGDLVQQQLTWWWLHWLPRHLNCKAL
jgi:hypothetical protein